MLQIRIKKPLQKWIMLRSTTRNGTWGKRRSASEQGLRVNATFGIFLCIASAFTISVVTSHHQPYNIDEDTVPAKTVTGPRMTRTVGPQGSHPMTNGGGADDVCYSPGCIRSASRILSNMNSDVNPCDDFYQFACGGFIKSAVFPVNESRVKSFSPIRSELENKLKKIIESPIVPSDLRAFRLVKNMYKYCMNKEDQGLKPIHEILKKLGGWPVLDGEMWNATNFDWGQSIRKSIQSGYDEGYFMVLLVGDDVRDLTKRIIYLFNPYFGLNRNTLLRGVDDETVRDYYSYMVDIAVLLGADRGRANTELKDSLLFEIELANIASRDYDPSASFAPMTLANLTENYPSIPWRVILNGLPNFTIEESDKIIVLKPGFIHELEKLMSRTHKRVQANYAMWRTVYDSVDHLNDINIRQRNRAYKEIQSDGAKQEPQWKECFDLVSKNLRYGADALYIRNHFDTKIKDYAIEMDVNIRQQFIANLMKAEWLDQRTRQMMIEKIAAMEFQAAYNDKVFDDGKLEELYENLEFYEDNYLQSVLNLKKFVYDQQFKRLRRPGTEIDGTLWNAATTPQGSSLFEGKSFHITAASFHDILFSIDRPKYMNYGTIGFTIGFFLLAALDSESRKRDKEYNKFNWTLSTEENYLQKAKCISDQYGHYTDEEIGLTLDGIGTLDENIRDNGAIKLAYLAYNDWVKQNGPEQTMPELPYSPKQMFWINAANLWCAKYTPESLRSFITEERHTPEKFKILGSFSNIPEFSTDFNCPVGSKMNPEKKCSVW